MTALKESAPEVSPAETSNRFQLAAPNDLAAVSHYCFGGKLDITQNFRALAIGGEALLDLASQLHETDSRIAAFVPNRAARAVAHGQIRKLSMQDQVEWVDGKLEDIGTIAVDPVDYVSCGDALARVDDPNKLLADLRPLMKDQSAMWLQVPGRSAQVGLQQLRELSGLVNAKETSRIGRVNGIKAVLDSLPASNWYKRSEALLTGVNPTEAALDCTRSFAINEVLQIVEDAGLTFAEFTTESRSFYEAGFAFRDETLRERILALPKKDQFAAAELFWGNIVWHSLWISTAEQRIDLNDMNNVPFFSKHAEANGMRDAILRADAAGQPFAFKLNGADGVDVNINFQVVPAARRFVELADNQRTLEQIVSLIADDYETRPSDAEVWNVCRHLLEILLKFDLMLLRR